MKPADLALPSKFNDWRTGQLDAVIAAACSERRFYLLSMPTGGGKSLAALAIANLVGGRALVLTATKGLQVQYMSDFAPAPVNMKDVRGQNNYRCIAVSPDGSGYPWTMVDDGPCHAGIECPLKARGCTYYDAIRAAAMSKVVVTNYSYWMTIGRYADPETIGKFDLLVLDEAHDAPDQLADFCAVTIDKDELHALLDLPLPPIDENQEVWAEWAQGARVTCVLRLAAAKLRVKEGAKYIKLVRRLTDMERRLTQLASAQRWRRGEPSDPQVQLAGQAVDWVAEYKLNPMKQITGAVFSPTWAHQYAEEVLFRGIPRVVLVSATLQPTTARYLGIAPEHYQFQETPSTFDPRRRPFIWIPTTTVDRNMTVGQERIWVNKIDAIIDGRLDRKGIIHTRSYDRAQRILGMSRHRAIMLSHGSRNAREVVEQFKRAQSPRVLISPSMETGWDFPYDECEYQIIAKVPFLDQRSTVIKARAKSDKGYLNYMTALSIIQQTGRGMRASDDQCETFIVDDHIRWFMPAAKLYFPKWFKVAYRIHEGQPPTPPPTIRRLSGR